MLDNNTLIFYASIKLTATWHGSATQAIFLKEEKKAYDSVDPLGSLP